VFAQRNAARREAAFERAAAQEARQVAQRAQAESASLREALAIEVAFRELVIRPQSRVASLAGLAPAPEANARVVWHSERREAVLLASGLAPAPAGKAYELWIIAKAAPVPAGVFQVDPQGRAVFRLPAGLDFAGVKTFAVTLEPEAGVPAPTGPMVLAGAVS
jgi:anti-sigma-K factor RskA